MPIITAWTVLICVTFYMFLTLQVIKARRIFGVSVGDGGDQMLLRRMRGQANAAEQMPLTLLALLMAEMMGGATVVLIILAATFTASRVAHGIAFGWLEHSFPLRFFGMLGSSMASLATLAYLALILIGVV